MTSFSSLSRRIVNEIRGPVNHRIVYIHIPKCAGSSIKRAICANYFTADLRKDRSIVTIEPAASSFVANIINNTNYPYDESDDFSIFKFRESLLLYFLNQKNIKPNFIHGHITFSELAYKQFKEEISFITILRDPIDRWISTYFYNRYKDSDHYKMDIDIEKYLDSPFGKAQGYTYVKFLGGAHENRDYTSTESIGMAIQNIRKFKLVALLEDQENMLEQFKQNFNFELDLEVRNASPKSHSYQKSVITPQVMEAIKEICRPDSEIYDYVKNNLKMTEARALG
jgi:hypothetical protein